MSIARFALVAFVVAACGGGGDDTADDAPPAPVDFDVIVVGAGTGGVGAGVQAARMGARVALLEETTWIGGQLVTVPSMDEWSQTERDYGIYGELIARVTAHYATLGKSIGTCGFSALKACFEPAVGSQILRAILAEAGVDVRLATRVASVTTDGSKVTGLVTDDGTAYTARIVIDATEYGDVIPLTPARYRVGRSTSDAIDAAACVQDITYAAVVRKYPGAGPPTDLVLSAPPPGYADEAPMFDLIVAVGGSMWDHPPYPVDFVTHNAYRGAPDSSSPGTYDAGSYAAAAAITKTSLNFANDYPASAAYNLPPGPPQPTLPVAYLEDRDERARIECAAKLRTLQFVHHVQTALGEPAWSIADDQGFDEPARCPAYPTELAALERRMPPRPYVRESRRVLGLHTLTAPEIKRVGTPPMAAVPFVDSLAVGGYGDDLHNCRADEYLEPGLETLADASGLGPFQVPFGSFVPETVDGFLVAEKNLSVSRMVNGAIRLQPITMFTGQAAGAIAALGVQRGVEPRALPPIAVQDALVRAGLRLSLYRFDDVLPTHPAWADVEIASTYRILVGSGPLFRPDDPLTRAGGAVAIAKLFDLPLAPPPTPTFDDVSEDHVAYAYVEALVAAGFTSGCSTQPPRFCPDAPLERGQLAAFLARGHALDTASPGSQRFDDVSPDHPLFAQIQVVAAAGLMAGCGPTTFCPDAAETRGNTARAIRASLIRLHDR